MDVPTVIKDYMCQYELATKLLRKFVVEGKTKEESMDEMQSLYEAINGALVEHKNEKVSLIGELAKLGLSSICVTQVLGCDLKNFRQRREAHKHN